ncbi:hypothetical protein MLD38_039266 [Melastoma candidum]|uniref:Uncharacterized protein n=1 Tax=Melastoma candidum TaxID=119954 RepID=A0ACB9L2F1_9MYRT|nr:hypothetical protein MLD38_039266 [Melastoma candidum]
MLKQSSSEAWYAVSAVRPVVSVTDESCDRCLWPRSPFVATVYIHTAPLCHVGGLLSALAMFMVGAHHVFIPKFDPGLAVDAIQKHSVNSLITEPTFTTDRSSFFREKESWKGTESIRKLLNGGGSLPLESTSETIRLFPSARSLSAYSNNIEMAAHRLLC